MTPPRVSVVIATWNWSSALRHSLASALAQTVRELEVIVVGDGCTDDTAEVVAAAGDARVRYVPLPARTGSQAAPNTRGIAEARAPWIAYLGHDDLWHPRHLELLLAAAERDDADVAASYGIVLGPPGSPRHGLSGATASGRPEPAAFTPPSTLIHRRDLTARIGPWADPATCTLPVDVELLQRAWDAGLRFASSGAATAFKLPAAQRRDAYRRRDATEQAELAARLAADPDRALAEVLTDVAASLALHGGAIVAPDAEAPGAIYRRNLAYKGAEEALVARPPRVARVGADALAGAGEWYGLETDRLGRQFRWSGPGTLAQVDLVVDAARPLVVEALVVHAVTAEQRAGAALVADGVALPTRRAAGADGAGVVLRAVVPPAAARGADPSRLRLGVVVPRTERPADVDPAAGDRRQLGVAVAWLGARPADASDA